MDLLNRVRKVKPIINPQLLLNGKMAPSIFLKKLSIYLQGLAKKFNLVKNFKKAKGRRKRKKGGETIIRRGMEKNKFGSGPNVVA